MKRSRSPQEKKVLSYAKDGRNTVAEARSKSRTSIAKHKASANRALRRAEVVAVSKADPTAEVVDVVVPFLQHPDEVLLQRIPGVVAADRNAHPPSVPSTLGRSA